VANRGTYFAATGAIAGSVVAQNLLSIENPVASPSRVFLRRVRAQSASTVATIVFWYKLTRTVGMPTLGVVLPAVLHTTSDFAPQAIVRSSPTAVSTGDTATLLTPGALITAAGDAPSTIYPVFDSVSEDDAMILDPGEAAVIIAIANLVTINHFIDIMWGESFA